MKKDVKGNDLLKLELVDKNGTFISATAFKNDANRLSKEIDEGKIYKINRGKIS